MIMYVRPSKVRRRRTALSENVDPADRVMQLTGWCSWHPGWSSWHTGWCSWRWSIWNAGSYCWHGEPADIQGDPADMVSRLTYRVIQLTYRVIQLTYRVIQLRCRVMHTAVLLYTTLRPGHTWASSVKRHFENHALNALFGFQLRRSHMGFVKFLFCGLALLLFYRVPQKLIVFQCTKNSVQ